MFGRSKGWFHLGPAVFAGGPHMCRAVASALAPAHSQALSDVTYHKKASNLVRHAQHRAADSFGSLSLHDRDALVHGCTLVCTDQHIKPSYSHPDLVLSVAKEPSDLSTPAMAAADAGCAVHGLRWLASLRGEAKLGQRATVPVGGLGRIHDVHVC